MPDSPQQILVSRPIAMALTAVISAIGSNYPDLLHLFRAIFVRLFLLGPKLTHGLWTDINVRRAAS